MARVVEVNTRWRSADLSVRVAVPVLGALALAVLLNLYIWKAATAATIDASIASATATAQQFTTLRA